MCWLKLFVRSFLPAFYLFIAGCSIHLGIRPQQLEHRDADGAEFVSKQKTLRNELEQLGRGIEFRNKPAKASAEDFVDKPEFFYSRRFSANSRVSPVGIEVWIFDGDGQELHSKHRATISAIYDELYRWNPDEWSALLEDSPRQREILKAKSDIFWESLQQQMAERIFGDYLSDRVLLFGPSQKSEVSDSVLYVSDADRVVIRTYLEAARDPLNPVTRTITYDVRRGHLKSPRIILELAVPNGIRVLGPYRENLDLRPEISGQKESFAAMRIYADLPSARRPRYRSEHYPDYNLLFVPLRHLLLQGEVNDPKVLGPTKSYEDVAAFRTAFLALLSRMRDAASARTVAADLEKYLVTKYYYMFKDNLASYKSYILSPTIGIGRGLNPDFGRIELWGDEKLIAVSDYKSTSKTMR